MEQEDRVICCLQHPQKLLATHYHGFDQPGVMDRQVHHLIFERGEIEIHGWIPETLSMKILANEVILRQILESCPGGQYKILQHFPDSQAKK